MTTRDELPTFRYHPDPLTTGSIIPSEARCSLCCEARGYVYDGPVYPYEETRGGLCPWCIEDGRAHAELAVDFIDPAGVGDYGSWAPVSDEVRDIVAYRTPTFFGWQQQRWFTCCGDAAAFLGIVGRKELEAAGPQAIEAIRSSGARLVLLALGAPKQEIFAARAQRALPEVGFLSIGAGIDFISGFQNRAPAWARRARMEWLWRVVRNPGRLAGRYAGCFAALPGLGRAAWRHRHRYK